jgi:hypothetical protein
MAERDAPRGTEGSRTPRWREQDSNHRSRVRRPIFECRLGLIPRRPKKSARKRTGTRRVGRIPAGPMVRILLSPAVSRHEILQLPGRPRDLGRLARPLARRDRGNEGVRRYLTRTSKVCFRLSLTCYRRHRSGWRAPRSDRPPPVHEGRRCRPDAPSSALWRSVIASSPGRGRDRPRQCRRS